MAARGPRPRGARPGDPEREPLPGGRVRRCATADRVADRFEWVELGEHKLRGKSEAIRIYRILRERDAEGVSRERDAHGGENR